MAFANLTAPRDIGRKEGELVAVPMTAMTIYKGSLVILNAGQARVTVGANLPFAGVASETKTCAVAGATSINVFTSGVFEFDVAAVQASDIGKEAYLDSGSSGNPGRIALSDPGAHDCKVGRVVGVVSATKALVRIDGYAMYAQCNSS